MASEQQPVLPDTEQVKDEISFPSCTDLSEEEESPGNFYTITGFSNFQASIQTE